VPTLDAGSVKIQIKRKKKSSLSIRGEYAAGMPALDAGSVKIEI
jgi:hypothetical protein